MHAPYLRVLNRMEKDYVNSLYALFGVSKSLAERMGFLALRREKNAEASVIAAAVERRELRNLATLFTH